MTYYIHTNKYRYNIILYNIVSTFTHIIIPKYSTFILLSVFIVVFVGYALHSKWFVSIWYYSRWCLKTIFIFDHEMYIGVLELIGNACLLKEVSETVKQLYDIFNQLWLHFCDNSANINLTIYEYLCMN